MASDIVLKKIIKINGAEKYLRYTYKENLCFCENMDVLKIGDNNMVFTLDENNEYDKDTVIASINNKKIGLMYKGDARDIMISCIRENRYTYVASVIDKNEAHDKIRLLIGFYTDNDTKVSITATIVKTSKISPQTHEKRIDMLEFLNVGDEVCLTNNLDYEGILVLDKDGNELGELVEKISDKLKNMNITIENTTAVVTRIDNYDTKKTSVKIKIYI